MLEIEGAGEWVLYGSCLVLFDGRYGLIATILSLITR
jgi:predicted Co/Zn/Cd cation transporter (cation efflux family)